MDEELSRLSHNGMTVSVTRENGMSVTADTNLKAGATWRTSEINHLSLVSAISGFLNASLDRRMGNADFGIDCTEIRPGGDFPDVRIGVGPDGVYLIHISESGKPTALKVKEMGVDLLIEKLLAYKAQRDGLLSAEVPRT